MCIEYTSSSLCYTHKYASLESSLSAIEILLFLWGCSNWRFFPVNGAFILSPPPFRRSLPRIWRCRPLTARNSHVCEFLQAFKSFNNNWHFRPVFGDETHALKCKKSHFLCPFDGILARKSRVHYAAQPPAICQVRLRPIDEVLLTLWPCFVQCSPSS